MAAELDLAQIDDQTGRRSVGSVEQRGPKRGHVRDIEMTGGSDNRASDTNRG